MDPLEQLFASEEVREQVEELEAADKIRLTTRRIGKLLVLEVGARSPCEPEVFEIPQDEDEGIDNRGRVLRRQRKTAWERNSPPAEVGGTRILRPPANRMAWRSFPSRTSVGRLLLKQPHPVMLVIGTFPEEDDRFGDSQKKRFENVRWM